MVTVHAAMKGLGNPGEILRFGREGRLGPDVQLVHCNTLTFEEWRMVADTGTAICFTPTVEMQMGHGVPPVQAAIDAGVAASLGVDVETSAPGDLWTQMRATYALQRMQANERRFAGEPGPAGIGPEDLLRYVTTAGAINTRLQDKVGSLAPGKQADIVLLRGDLPNAMPVNDMKSSVALIMDARNVDTVLVSGKFRKRGGELVGVNLNDLGRQLYASRDRLYRDAGQALPSSAHRVG